MKKLIFFLVLIGIFLSSYSCKKKFQPYLPKGWYIGGFIYDSAPEKNFKDSFFCTRDFNNQQYEFITINILDSVQKSIQYLGPFLPDVADLIFIDNNIIKGRIIMKDIYLEKYNSYGNFKHDSLTGKFSLIYLP